jgi:beta-lactamase regulating signal transducer with metallopeptidase domain
MSPLIVDIVLKVTVVLSVAPLAARLLSRRSAAARHQIWAVAMAAALIMPLLTTVAPQWTIAVLPAPAAVLDIAPMSERPVVPSDSSVKTAATDPVFEPVPAMTPTTTAELPSVASSATEGLSTLTTIWLAGVLVVLARLAFGTARVWWIARRATPATDWAPLGQHLARAIGIERHVTFLSGDEDAMPMAWGLVRAHVLLPAEADEWPMERQRVVLLHELAHVKRRDCLTQMLAQLACAAYWFNPLVWLAAKRLRAERERACDDLVLAAGTRGSDYADHLLDIARSLKSAAWPTWSAVTMAHRSQLEGRLMAILDPALPRRSPTRRSVAVFAAVAIVSIVSLAGVRGVAKAAEAEQGRPSSLVMPTPMPAPTPTPMPTPAPVAPPAPLVAVVPMPMPAPVAMPMPRPAPMPTPVAVPVPPAPPVPFAAQNIDIDVPSIAIEVEKSVTRELNAFNWAFAQSPRGQDNRSPADPKITAALTAALKDENQEVRQQALNTLVRMRAPIPPEVFSSMLKDKSSEVRHQAVFALGQQRDVKYVGVIVDALKDSDAEVRQQAAHALGQIRDRSAVDPLITALKDTNPEVRQQAAHALGQIRDARAADALIAALKDTNPDVRQQAVHALGQIR